MVPTVSPTNDKSKFCQAEYSSSGPGTSSPSKLHSVLNSLELLNLVAATADGQSCLLQTAAWPAGGLWVGMSWVTVWLRPVHPALLGLCSVLFRF